VISLFGIQFVMEQMEQLNKREIEIEVENKIGSRTERVEEVENKIVRGEENENKIEELEQNKLKKMQLNRNHKSYWHIFHLSLFLSLSLSLLHMNHRMMEQLLCCLFQMIYNLLSSMLASSFLVLVQPSLSLSLSLFSVPLLNLLRTMQLSDKKK
jgi:hypothetical protein